MPARKRTPPHADPHEDTVQAQTAQAGRIRVYHTGRIARSRPTSLCPGGMLWSRDMRFLFANVPAGDYVLELQMKETQRFDSAASDASVPVVDVYVDGHPAARHVKVQTERPEDDFAAVPVPVKVGRLGFDLRIYAPRSGLNIPCVCGMRLLKTAASGAADVVYAFTAGDARERAMWSPAEVSAEAGTVRTERYEELLHSGLPLGGIGTGRLELLTNGALGSFSCANNWDIPTFWAEGSFFALWTEAGAGPGAMLLHPPRTAGGWGLPTARAVNFRGRYPVAQLGYDLGPVPLRLRLRAQGSVVPGNSALSSLPAATLTFSVANTGTNPVGVALLASLENLSGQGGFSYIKHDWSESYRERFDSVDGAVQRPWQARTIKGLLFTNDREPRDAREANAFTDYALGCEGHGGVSRCIAWNVDDARPAFWDAFAANGTLPPGNPRAVGKDGPPDAGGFRPAGAIAKKISLEPGQSADVVFILAWYHNGHTTFRDGVNHGHAYGSIEPQAEEEAGAPDADGEEAATPAPETGGFETIEDVALAAAENRAVAAALVDRWQGMLRDSSLPRWLQTKLVNGAFPATTSSVWTADGFFSVHESPTEMCGAVGTIDQRMAAHPFTFTFFPELDRLELDWFRRCQQPDGQIPHMIGNVYDKLGAADTFFCVTGWPDLSCSFIFQTYRHFLYTGDRAWLARNFDAYARAIAWMRSTDNLGLGLPIGGCTYDYEAGEWKVGAPMIFNAVCYLGALRAAIDAARRLGREDLAADWAAAFAKAHDTLMSRYWNGRYFRKWIHPEKNSENPNCFVSQLAGDWFVRLLGLEPLFTDDIVDSVLDSIVALNMLPHHPAILMEATPDGQPATDSCYVQQHEPYLGMELIYRGRVKRGLEVLQRRHDITWRVNSNPWGEALAVNAPSGREMLLFDYMTAAAGWNVLPALAGMTVDAERGLLKLRPQMDGSRSLRLPVFMQDLWLMLDVDVDRPAPVSLEVVHRGPKALALDAAEVEIEGAARRIRFEERSD